MIDRDSEPGAYTKALMFPPYAGALGADGEFRRGFAADAPRRHDTGAPGASDGSFHAAPDTPTAAGPSSGKTSEISRGSPA